MIYEIVSTVTEKGLLKNSSGFCPVAVTEGIPKKYIKPLAELAKRQIEEADNLRENTTDFYSHFPLILGDQHFNLLTRGSRLPPNGDNKSPFVVHQVLFDQLNLRDDGPAAILANDSFWITRWSAKPQLLKPRTIEAQPMSPRICRQWEQVTGDAGWASCPVEAWEKKKSCVLLTPPALSSRDVINMLVESQSLIPNEQRWQILIAVAAWHPFEVDERFWMAFDRGTQAALDSMHHADTERIDLTSTLNRASGKYSEEARSGAWVRSTKSESGIRTPSKMLKLSGVSMVKFEGTENHDPDLELKETFERPKTVSLERKKTKSVTKQVGKLPSRPQSSKKTSNGALSGASTRWIKILLIGIVILGIGIGLKMGAQTVINMANALSSAEALESPVVQKQARPIAKAPPVDSQDKIDHDGEQKTALSTDPDPNSTASGDPTGSVDLAPPPAPSVSSQMVLAAFEQIDAPAKFDLAPADEMEKQRLFSVPLGSALLSDYVLFSLDTTSTRRTLTWNIEENAWLVGGGDDGRNPFATIVMEVAEGEGDGDGCCDFFWKWSQQTESKTNSAQIQAGRIVVGLRGASSYEWVLPLAAPAQSETFKIIDTVLKPPVLKPHLPEYVCRADVFPLFEWQVAGMKIASQPAGNADAWLPPEIADSPANRIVVPISNDYLRSQLAEMLKTNLSETNVYSDLVKRLIDYHGPFGMRMDFSFSLQDQEMIMDIRSQVLMESPGADNSSIILRPWLATKSSSRSKQVDAIKSKIVDGLMEHLSLGGKDMRKIITAGGKGCKSAKTPEEEVKASLAD